MVLKPEINLNPFKKDKNTAEVYPGKMGHPKKKNKQTDNTRIKKTKIKKQNKNTKNGLSKKNKLVEEMGAKKIKKKYNQRKL